MPVGDEDYGGVSAAPPVALGRFHDPLDLGLGQVLPPAQLGVGTPPRHDCSFYGGWRDQPEARLSGTALQAKAPKRPATIEGAWEAQASPWVSQPLEPLSGTGANNASLWTVSLHRAAGRALPLRGRCLQHFRQPHLGHVREGHPEQRADAIVDGLDVRDSRIQNCPPRWNGAKIFKICRCSATFLYVASGRCLCADELRA